MGIVLAACSSDATSSDARGARTSAGTKLLAISVNGAGVIRSEPAGIECPGRCEAEIPIGTRIRLVAEPAEGWKLTGWSGACTGGDACEIALTDGEASAITVSAALGLVDSRWDPSVGRGDCKDAWGERGEKLSPCDKTPDDYVVVNKAKRNIALCKDGNVVKNFRVGLGFTPEGDKKRQGDGRTPEGVLYIPRLLPDSDYHKAFLLSYPRKEDSARAFHEGLISKPEYEQIIQAQNACTEPLQDTKLGGAVEIHGEGSSKDWTAGCVGMENGDIDVLWSVLEVGDTIVVLP